MQNTMSVQQASTILSNHGWNKVQSSDDTVILRGRPLPTNLIAYLSVIPLVISFLGAALSTIMLLVIGKRRQIRITQSENGDIKITGGGINFAGSIDEVHEFAEEYTVRPLTIPIAMMVVASVISSIVWLLILS